MKRRTTMLICAAALQAGSAWGATIAYYRFENGVAGAGASGNGTILDSSGNGLNGTAVNSPVYSSDVPVTTIPEGGAGNTLSLSFNGTQSGSDQRVFIPDNPLFKTASLTIEAYVKVTGAPNDFYDLGQIFFRGDTTAANDPYTLGVIGNGSTATFQIENTAIVNASIPLNQWVFLAATMDGATGRESIYVNGQLANSQITSLRTDAALNPSLIPGEAIGSLEVDAGPEVFPGLIDEVRISNTALNPAQFLDVVPEPTCAGFIAIAATSILIRRKRARRRMHP